MKMQSAILTSSACALVTAALVAGCQDSTRKEEAEKQNAAILDGLPQLPSAKKVKSESNPYYDEDNPGEPQGYTTRVEFELSERAGVDDVLAFYASRLKKGWRCRRESNELPVLTCKRGSTLLSINAFNVRAGEGRFEITVQSMD